jgi:hypothetical protein
VKFLNLLIFAARGRCLCGKIFGISSSSMSVAEDVDLAGVQIWSDSSELLLEGQGSDLAGVQGGSL